MTEENPEVTLECRRPLSGFDKSVYLMETHNFCNGIIIPHKCFDQLDIQPYSYVRVSPVSVKNDHTGTILYAIPFDREMGPDNSLAALSTNLMQKIHPNLGTGDEIRLQPLDVDPYNGLTVQAAYSDGKTHGCYISRKVLNNLGCTVGEKVEIINTRTGGRAVIGAHALRPNDESKSKIRLELPIIQSLGLDIGDEVKVQRAVDIDSMGGVNYLQRLIRESILEPLVGSRTVQLNVRRGLPQDEERNIVRIAASTRQYLGIETQDKVEIEWKGQRVVAQCLPPTSSDDSVDQSVKPLDILIPSSLRDQIGVSPNDTINVRRDLRHVFREQVSLSILGILGVVFGTFQILNTTGWIPLLVRQFGRVYTTVLIIGIAGVLSIPTLFFIFLPVRNEVRY